MPPKPQTFKTPDGKEFSSKIEWRDYMFATFYSFKNRKDEPEPLVKKPGDIDGQMFDIADCENVTIAIMDNVEQVQIDQVKNSRIFIGACASSIFIRNCENCVFYTCCRQLRLRDVTKSSFYIYSMSEVHIEFTNEVKFAPFNGGYPEHGSHLSKASLDVNHNLWYDIFDHNDPGKTHVNWSLLPESEYEKPWYPAGTPCEHAIPLTKSGSVVREVVMDSMQSFGAHQLVQDASASATTNGSKSTSLSPPPPAAATTTTTTTTEVTTAEVNHVPIVLKEEDIISSIIKTYANYKAGDDISTILKADFRTILSNGVSITAEILPLVIAGGSLYSIDSVKVHSLFAYSTFWIAVLGGGYVHVTAIFEKIDELWKLVHAQRSEVVEKV